MLSVSQRQNRDSGSSMCMKPKMPLAVNRQAADQKPALLFPKQPRPNANITRNNASAEKASGSRAAQSCNPKILKLTAMHQGSRGGASKKGTPFRWNVTQSLVTRISRAISASVASTPSNNGGRTRVKEP